MLTQHDIQVRRELLPGEVAVERCTTIEQTIGRLQVLTERYGKQGYLAGIPEVTLGINPEEVLMADITKMQNVLDVDAYAALMDEGLVINFKDGNRLFIDKYHWQSIGFVAKTSDGYAGSVRLIISNAPGDFQIPTLSSDVIHISPEWEDMAKHVNAELSQFAKKKGAPPGIAVALLRSIAIYSKEIGIDVWLATIDAIVQGLLNGSFFNFGLPQIGDDVFYLGSISKPVYIDIDKSLNNAAQHEESVQIAEFIRGGSPAGFDWYLGL